MPPGFSTTPAARSCTSTPAWRDSPAAWCSASAWDTAGRRMPPHNLTLTLIGASLLWVGWFGFNAGSAGAADGRAGMAMLVTQMATAAAALGWMFAEWVSKGKPSVLGIASGAVAGLVAITPASGFVGPIVRRGHRPGGRRGLLRRRDLAQACAGIRRLAGRIRRARHRRHRRRAAHRGLRQQGNQRRGRGVMRVADSAAREWLSPSSTASLASYVILKVIDMTIGLRVTEEQEREGLGHLAARRKHRVVGPYCSDSDRLDTREERRFARPRHPVRSR